jgi:tetratricopeptide (TPR) repeat protein
VAAAVGDLPLALGLAGHFLARYRETSVDDYLAELSAAPELVPVGRDAVSATRHELSVWRTFSVSLDRLADDDPIDQLAKELLSRAACFAPGEPLPEALLRAAAVDADGETLSPPRDLTDAIHALDAAGLLERPGEGVLRLHRLLARFVANKAGEGIGQARAAVEAAVIRQATQQNEAGDPRALREWEIHLRHAVVAAGDREDETAATLCNRLGYYLNMSGDLSGARPYFERALAVLERALGPEHPDTATSLNNMGYLLRAQGDLAGARPYLRAGAGCAGAGLGAGAPGYGAEPQQHGLPAACPGRPGRGAAVLRAGAGGAGARPGAGAPGYGDEPQQSGHLLQAQGDLAGARPYLERALAVWERVLGPEHPQTARASTTWAACCMPRATWPGRGRTTSGRWRCGSAS